MKKNKYLFILLLLGCYNSILAQSTFKFPANYPEAYTEYIYDAKDVKMVTETYATNVPKLSFPTNVNNAKENLLLDIYYAENSSIDLGLRPIIFFSPGGGMEKSSYKFFGDDLARRGYVVVSINIRGSLVQELQLMFNTKNIHPVLTMTAAMDLHLATNYMIYKRAQAFNIDTNSIIYAGGSFGGVISLQGTFMDRVEANQKYGKNVNNNFFNDYEYKLRPNIKGIVDFYGAMYDLNFIQPSDSNMPIYIYHGTLDPAAPYNEGNIFYSPLQPYMYGSIALVEKLKKHNNSFYFITAKDVGHSITPQCNYDVKSFPKGYPQNWYPDMLYFIKNAILGNQKMQIYKTIDCIEPECSLNKNSCRLVSDDANNASKKPSNGNNLIPVPNFSKSIANVLPDVLKTSNKNLISNNNVLSSDIQPNKISHCKAFSFDGNNFIKLNNSPSLAIGFEVDFWFKQSILNPENNIQILYSIGTSNNINNSSFTLGLLGNNQIYLGYYNGNKYIENTQNIINEQSKIYTLDNNWHHIHFKVFNGSLTGEIDENKGVFSFINAIKTTVNTNNNSITYFGGANFSTGNITRKYNNAIGQMHELRLWQPNTYSPNYINNSVSPTSKGLVLYWRMDANSQIVKDEAQYKIDGTLGNSNSVEKSDPTFVNNCDGSNVTSTNINSTTIPETTTTNNVTSPKSDTVTVPVVIQDGINVINTDQKPLIMFNTQKGGKAIVKIINSANKLLVTKTVVITKGTNSLFSIIQNLKQGNYTITVTLNSKKYTQKFTIPK